jgi:chromosome segregation ATPase
MLIKPDYVYSIKEVSNLLNINSRKIQRVAKKHNLKKTDNRYLFDGVFLLKVFKEEIEEVSQSLEQLSQDVATVSQDVETYLLENEALENEIKELKEQLSIYEIEENERIEIFTNDEYKLFETRLNEWRLQQNEIEKQSAEIQEVKTTAKENVEHYKNLFEYQRKQSDRILQIHEKLVGSLGELTKASVQRNIIEAKDKDIINDAWKPK